MAGHAPPQCCLLLLILLFEITDIIIHLDKDKLREQFLNLLLKIKNRCASWLKKDHVTLYSSRDGRVYDLESSIFDLTRCSHETLNVCFTC